MALTLLHKVLHARDVEFKLVHEDLILVAQNDGVGWVLGIDMSENITPTENGERHFSDSGMNWCCILSVPNDERVVLTDTSQEATIRTES